MTVVPAVGRARAPRLPTVAERALASGLRAVAVRRAGVPLVEVRLRVPVARARAAGDGARERLVAETLMSGTATRSAEAVAQDLQRMGASLSVSIGTDALTLSGSTLSPNLGPFLALVGEILTQAAFSAAEVDLGKTRLAQELTISRSQPGVVAGEALRRRLYGRHPYGRGLPEPAAVLRLTPGVLRGYLAHRVLPAGSVLVLVGAVRPERALDAAEESLAGWTGGEGGTVLATPAPAEPGPVVLVDRPGAVQTNIRLGGRALARAEPGYPALAVANLIFGGYASSRLFDNIRERRGYTYSPRSSLDHHRAVSQLSVVADVATEVTAPALVEIRYELARMASAAVHPAELDDARRYLPGTLALTTQTQGGLASYLTMLLATGLGVEYLRDFPRALARVGVEDVAEAGRRWLAPRRLVTVMVGDAERVVPELEALEAVDVRLAPSV